MKKISEVFFFFGLGGTLYYVIEVLFRGFSHWTMFIDGGICFDFLWWQGIATNGKVPLWRQILRGTVFVASVEFITGIIVNGFLGWHIWDYTKMPFQLFGQICLPFTFLFAVLCTGGIFLSGFLSYKLFGEIRPEYHIF